jgi:outer membrane protein assembly factor BamB
MKRPLTKQMVKFAVGIVASFSIFAGVTGCASFNKTSDFTEMRFHRSWSRQTVSSDYMGYRQPATVSPVLAGDLVIESNGVDAIKAFHGKSGNMKWQIPLSNGTEGVQYEKASGGIFFGANDGQFYSVNGDTGTVLWNFPLNSESTAAPLIQGNYLFHLAMNGTLYAFEKDTGRVLWVKSRPSKDAITIRGSTSPVFENGRVYVGYSDGYFISYNAADGSPLWETKLADNKKFNDVDTRPAITSKCILVANFTDSLFCLNKTSGEILWQLSEGGSSQPVIVEDENVYYSSETAIMVIDLASGKIKKKFDMPKEFGIPTAAVPFKSWLIFGLSEGPLVLMEKDSGRWADKFFTGRGISAPVTVDPTEDAIFVVSNQANIYKFFIKNRDRNREFLWAKP